MEFITETVAGVTVVSPQVDVVDAGNAMAFKKDIAPLIQGRKNVLLDMARIGFLDSSGCGAVLSLLRQLNSAGGDLKMVNVQKPVLALLELIRLHRVIEIHNSRESAVRAFA